MDEILTVSTINEVPHVTSLPESLNDHPPPVHSPTSESNVEISTPSSSETKVKITTEVKFAASSETEGKSTSLTSLETGMKFTELLSPETKENFITPALSENKVELNNTPSSEAKVNITTPSPSEVEMKSFNQNALYASKDIRYKKTKIKKSKQEPFSPVGYVKKKV